MQNEHIDKVQHMTSNSYTVDASTSDLVFILSLLAAHHLGQLHSLPDRPLQGIVGGDGELSSHHAVA